MKEFSRYSAGRSNSVSQVPVVFCLAFISCIMQTWVHDRQCILCATAVAVACRMWTSIRDSNVSFGLSLTSVPRFSWGKLIAKPFFYSVSSCYCTLPELHLAYFEKLVWCAAPEYITVVMTIMAATVSLLQCIFFGNRLAWLDRFHCHLSFQDLVLMVRHKMF